MTNLSFELYQQFFSAFCNKTRFEIINLLSKSPKNVSEISKNLKFEQSRVSHNLKKLECCGFINSKSKGKHKIYSIDKRYMLPIIKNINKYIKKYDKRLNECFRK